jgi:putative glutamine amidotransferase
MTPRVGLTTWTRPLDTGLSGVQRLHSLAVEYTRHVAEAGGVPLMLASGRIDHAPLVLDTVDALVVTGGDDVDPARYDAALDPHTRGVDQATDAWDIALVQEAARRSVPLLGVCRGIQVVAVALGGTLHQHVLGRSDDHPELARSPDDLFARRHAAVIAPGSRLAEIMGAADRQVNSMHDQAVDRVPDGWCVTATAPDGVIEAMEPVDDRWPAVAVQWHPERTNDPLDARLFEWLVGCARDRTLPPADVADLTIDGVVTTPFTVRRTDGAVTDLLTRAEVGPGADHGTVHAAGEVFTASIPLEWLQRASLVDGRLRIPTTPNRCWDVKDVVRIELTVGKQPDSVEE